MISDTSVYDIFSFRDGIDTKKSEVIATLLRLFLQYLTHNQTLIFAREVSKPEEVISNDGTW